MTALNGATTKALKMKGKKVIVTKPVLKTLSIILVLFFISACVAQKDTILPTKHERMTLVDAYKRCVANATNTIYDAYSMPDVIVRNAMNKCMRTKSTMLKEYPKSWRKSLEQEVDEELYRREIAWITETRKQRQPK